MSDSDPVLRFQEAFDRANTSESFDACRAVLATVGATGAPSARFVLVKRIDSMGMVVYTNLGSRKALEMVANPSVALAFHWSTTGIQVRVEGAAQLVDDGEADAYFRTRPRGSQIGAWASAQSQEVSGRSELEGKVAEISERFAGQDVPRPSFWSGFRIVPRAMEFWENQDDRLHDRWRYERSGASWSVVRLQP